MAFVMIGSLTGHQNVNVVGRLNAGGWVDEFVCFGFYPNRKGKREVFIVNSANDTDATEKFTCSQCCRRSLPHEIRKGVGFRNILMVLIRRIVKNP